MKKIMGIVAVLLMIFGTMAFMDADPTVEQIIKKSEDKLRGTSNESELIMKIVREDWTRTVTMKGWALGEDYSLTLIKSPARDKGTAFLKRKKEIWNWQPRIDRAVKLPPSMMMQSWMGSDLKNDDLVRQSSIIDDYHPKLLGKVNLRTGKTEKRLCYKVQLIPKEEAAVAWGKVVMFIDTKEYLQLKTKFYDEDGELTNAIYGKHIKNIGGRMLPSMMVVRPADEPKNKTILQYKSIKFDVPLKPSFFSIQNMKKVR